MAFNLSKFKAPTSNSWNDFYLNMSIDMTQNSLNRRTGVNAFGQLTKATGEVIKTVGVESKTLDELQTINENYNFAKQLTEEYDKVIQSGKTLIGGVPIKIGNTAAMQSVLIGLLGMTKFDKNGDLLRDIGPAILAYWMGAQTDKIQTPNIPCIGSIKNIKTIMGITISPGVWTAISLPPMADISPWLLNFIVSANVHLLTISGFFTCNCQYPPPAPPAPGILPWQGYYVKPFSSNPLKSTQEITKFIKATAANAIQDPKLQSAIEALTSGDTTALNNAATQLNSKG